MSYYSLGYKKGGSVVGTMRSQLLEVLGNTADERLFDALLKDVSDRVFAVGFSQEQNRYEEEIKIIDADIARIEEQFKKESESVADKYGKELELVKQELATAKERVSVHERELEDIQREETEKLRSIPEKGAPNQYKIPGLIKIFKELLAPLIKDFGNNVLKYGYASIVVFLLAGDYYIAYTIFNDILKIEVRDPTAIYIFSGVVALVFLVLIEFFIEYLESNPRKNARLIQAVKAYSVSVIAVILLFTYLLIISVSLFPEHNAARIIDAILRLLFLPLVIAAALMIRRIRKEFGFDFLLSPFKLIIFSAGLVLVSIPLPLEILARKFYTAREQATPRKKETLASLKQERWKLINAEKSVSMIGQKLLLEKSRLEKERRGAILILKKQKNKTRVWFESLRRGSDDAVFSELRQAR